MKKSSKILAVLLTVCLLCGVLVAVVASADGNSLVVTENSLNRNSSFDTSTTGISHTGSNNAVGIKVTHNSAGYVNMSWVKGYYANNNAYPHPTDAELESGVWGDDRPETGSGAGVAVKGEPITYRGLGHQIFSYVNQAGDSYLTVEKVKGIKYSVFEFDFGADKYTYSYTRDNGKKVYSFDLDALKKQIENDTYVATENKAAAIKEAEDSKILAIYDGNMYFWFEGLTKVSGNQNTIYFHNLNGEWYIYNSSTAGTADQMFKISNEAGVLNRFSYVMKFVENENGTVTTDTDLYIDGEFAYNFGARATTTANVYRRFYISGNAGYEKHYAETYSMVFDNVASNFYTEADLKEYGLRGTLGAYDSNSYVEYNGVKYYFANEGYKYLIPTIKDGDTVNLPADLLDYTPAETVNLLKFVCKNGAKVTLSAEAEKNFDLVLADAKQGVYLCVNKKLADVQRDDLKVTNGYGQNDHKYYYTDFTTKDTYAVSSSDSDYATGIGHEFVNGYMRIFGRGSALWLAGEGARAWSTAAATANYAALSTAKYAVVDMDYGTDRYVISFTADVERTITKTGSKDGGNFKKEAESNAPYWNADKTKYEKTVTLTNETIYKTVTEAELKAILENPAAFKATLESKDGFVFSTGHDVSTANSTLTLTQKDVYTNVKIDIDSYRPAYIAGALRFQMLYTADNKRVKNVHAAYIVQDPESGLYYASQDGSYGEGDIPLSNKVGVTDHITIVIDSGVMNENYYTANVYINGEYLGSRKLNNSNLTIGNDVKIRDFGQSMDANKNLDCYSLIYDNAAINLYGTVVEGVNTATYTTENSYGVDDLVADLKAGTKNPVTKCADVFYTGKNVGYNGWVTTDGGATIKYTNSDINAALANLNNGDTVITTKHLNISSLPATVKSFAVKCFNGAILVLSGDAQNSFELREVDGGYCIYNLGASDLVGQLKPDGATTNKSNTFNAGSTIVGKEIRSDTEGTFPLSSSTNLGYLRIYRGTGAMYTAASLPSYGWSMSSWAANANDYAIDNLLDYKYTVIDYDFGTDRYTFSYKAQLERDDLRDDYDIAHVDEDGNPVYTTLYKTVESLEEYEMYKNNPDLLKGSTTYSSKSASYKYTDTVHAVDPTSISEPDLAFVDGMALNLYLGETFQKMVDDSLAVKSYDSRQYAALLYVVKGNDGRWYMSADNKYSSNDVLLANEVGVTDHITFVVYYANDALKFNSYVNGELVRSGNVPRTTGNNPKVTAYQRDEAGNIIYKTDETTGEFVLDDKGNKIALTEKAAAVKSSLNYFTKYDGEDENKHVSVSLRGLGVFLPTGSTANHSVALKYDDCYSFMMDNMAINWYDENYQSGDKNGIDDLIAGDISSLYDCEDVVYNRNYVADRGHWATTDDFASVTYIPGLFAENLTDGGKIITDAYEIYGIPAAVNSFILDSFNSNTPYIYASFVPAGNGVYNRYSAGTMANLDLTNDMTFNLYIPTKYENVKVDGVALVDKFVYGEEYYVYKWNAPVSSFDGKLIKVSVTVDGYEMTFPMTLDVVTWAAIAASNPEAYTEEGSELAKEIVDYKEAVAKYINADFDSNSVASLAAFREMFSADVAETLPEAGEIATNEDIKVGYIIQDLYKLSIQIETELGDPTVTFRYGIHGVEPATVTKTDEGVYVVSGIPAAYIDNVMTITVGAVTVEYSLVNYANTCAEETKPLAVALLEYAIAAEAFKESEVQK